MDKTHHSFENVPSLRFYSAEYIFLQVQWDTSQAIFGLLFVQFAVDQIITDSIEKKIFFQELSYLSDCKCLKK